MISIIEHIEYLIMSNDCVVVPGWGAFIAQYSASTYIPIASMLRQPSRKIGFNASITHNDGLLANSIVRRHNISYEQANEIIDSNVAIYRQLLESGSELPFGHMGYFMVNAEGNCEFSPFEHDTTCNDAFFGLAPVSILPLEQLLAQQENRAGEAPVVSTTASNDEQRQGRRGWFSSRAVKIAASIAMLLALGVLFSTPIAVHNNQQMASLNVPKVEKPKPAVIATPVKHKIVQPQRVQALPVEVKLKTDSKPEATTATHRVDDISTLKNDNSGKYYLVICTLSSQKQVDQFFAANAELRNQAKVQQKRGKYRIYIARSNNYGELLEKAQRLPGKWGTGWVTTD
ncbi:HU domain-containing protein [Sodaliphilus pleomorphus]|uniref:SPOR domain-containing protein n=1 Tax=Sodaliphilus pleomorphus TaxID=2606626 RepID=A0A6L5XDK8_9BACT|nr:hypothetical protein [Sodaliphilus pleomorphus]MSS17216.1 hypothetical protein [Sodaliphilus pleomorphus]